MKITINGSEHFLKQPVSVEQLVEELQLDPRKIAIEHNLCIVPANEYDTTFIQEGDVLEVVAFIGGG